MNVSLFIVFLLSSVFFVSFTTLPFPGYYAIIAMMLCPKVTRKLARYDHISASQAAIKIKISLSKVD